MKFYASHPPKGCAVQFGAFTLIELLVVVAIIAILAGLLQPALSRGTMAARATECRGNLHDVGLGLRMYCDEADAFPLGGGMAIMVQSSDFGWLMMEDWKETLAPFLGVKPDMEPVGVLPLRKLRCPQFRPNGQYAYNLAGTAKSRDPAHLGLGGYSAGARTLPIRESMVEAPADMAAIGDIAVKVSQDTFVPSLRFDVVGTDEGLWPGKSHSGQANLVFCDGHVESKTQKNWVSTNLASRARWNNDHQPHPETWKRP